MTNRDYIAKNDASRTRLKELAARASDEQLALALSGGWTIASALAHAGFWDMRIVVHVGRLFADVAYAPHAVEEKDVDWINDAAKPLCLGLTPRQAIEFTIAAAEQADAAVASLTDEQLARLEELGNPLSLVRAYHRVEHLEEAEDAMRRLARS